MFSADQSKSRISLCSFNILSQDLLEQNRSLYDGIDDFYLQWQNRRSLILRFLGVCNSDIVCLQEMQDNHFPELFSWFSYLGYDGRFAKREDPKTDGCAMFYKRSKFDLVEYSALNLKIPDSRALDRPNVAQICLLQNKTVPNLRICAANIHVSFNPNRGDVKLAQLIVLFSEIFSRTRNSPGGPIPPILLAGDFNAASNSPLWKFVAGEAIDVDLISRNAIAKNDLCFRPRSFVPSAKPLIPVGLRINEKCQKSTELDDDELLVVDQKNRPFQHELNLIPVHPGDMTPYGVFEWPGAFGNFYIEVDHIFYSNGSHFGLVPINASSFHYPYFAVCAGRIPSSLNGSDHFPLLVDFDVFHQNHLEAENLEDEIGK